jgi:hypothetical protein
MLVPSDEGSAKMKEQPAAKPKQIDDRKSVSKHEAIPNIKCQCRGCTDPSYNEGLCWYHYQYEHYTSK